MTELQRDHVYHALDGQTDEIATLQHKVALLEGELHQLKVGLRAMLVDVATELRDDSDWMTPHWQSGADTVAEHWWGKLSKKGMIFILGTAAAGLLLWLGSLGLIGKK